MNTIEIKYYNNRIAQAQENLNNVKNGGYKFDYELIDHTLNDYYEFYIDGTPFHKIILSMYDEIREDFLKNRNGLLGTRAKEFDELLVMALVDGDVNEQKIVDHFRKKGERLDYQTAGGLMMELGLKRPLLYGCKVCGDFDCGGISIRVKHDVNHYYWYFYDEHTQGFDRHLFTFRREQYEDVFKRYLASWTMAKVWRTAKH